MKAIRLMTSEELLSQREVGRMKERTDEQTDKPINYVSTHAIVCKA